MSGQMEESTVTAEQYQACSEMLYQEAQLLDANRLHEWVDLLTDDITYQVPIRTTQERSSEAEFSETSFHMDDDKSSIETRVERVESVYDWSENPPSRTRRNVHNIRIEPSGDAPLEVTAKNNLLLYRNKGDTTEYDLISAERDDTLRKDDGRWKLAERIVYLDHTIIGTNALPILL